MDSLFLDTMIGEMRERLNRAVSKTVIPQGIGGSNPPLSVPHLSESSSESSAGKVKKRNGAYTDRFKRFFGEMSEWSKVHAWKACVLERVPRVQIPLSPLGNRNIRADFKSRLLLKSAFGEKITSLYI